MVLKVKSNLQEKIIKGRMSLLKQFFSDPDNNLIMLAHHDSCDALALLNKFW